MKKFLFLAGVLFLTSLAQAQEENIKFPIAELGNCGSKAECKAYCDVPANKSACLNFAEKNGLMKQEEVNLARKMIKGEISGPGGCSDRDACEEYCDDLSHIKECIDFAEANNLMPPEELAEARKVRDAISQGVTPPKCRGRDECESFCRKPDNMQACLNFALKAGLMEEGEREEGEKMLRALEQGIKPPACAGKNECEEYCSREENFKECTDFARAAGFMSDEELKEMEEGSRNFRESLIKAPDEVKKCITDKLGKDISQISPGPAAGQAMRGCYEAYKPADGEQYGPGDPSLNEGKMRTGPGGCRNREECDAYCRSNPDECGNPSRSDNRMPPEGRPEAYDGGRPGQFPPEGMMPPRGMEGYNGDRSQLPPDGMRPPEGMMYPPSEGQPAPGDRMMPPPGGVMMPPPEGMIPPSGDMMPPPENSGGTAPEPAPIQSSKRSLLNMIANVLFAR